MDPRAYSYIDQRLRMVETEVTYLRTLLVQAGGTAVPAAPGAAATLPSPQPQPAWVAPGPANAIPSAKAARTGFSLEAFIVGRGLQIAGLIILLLGGALFLSITLPLLPPGGRVTIGLLAGVALIVGGAAARSPKWQFLGDGLIALGGGFAFLSIWAAGGLYQIVPRPAALLALAAVTAVACALSYARRSERLAIAAAIGGYLAPALLDVGLFDRTPIFGYLFVLSAGILALSRLAKFRYLDVVAFVGILPYAPSFYVPASASGTELARGLAFLGALFAEFLVALNLAAHRDRALSSDRVALSAGCVGALVLALEAELAAHRTLLGGALFLLAAVLIASVRVTRVPALLRETYAWLGLGCLTLAVPALANSNELGDVWAIEAAIVIAIGARVDRARIVYAGMALYGFTFLTIFADRFFEGVGKPDGAMPIFNAPFLSFAVLTGAAVFAELLIRRSRLVAITTLAPLLQVATHIAALTGLSIELFDVAASPHLTSFDTTLPFAERAQFSLSLLWTFYGAGLFGFGLRYQKAILRYLAIGLFVLTIGKVFSIDLAFLSVTYRFMLSFVLGLVLIGASILYQRAAARTEKS